MIEIDKEEIANRFKTEIGKKYYVNDDIIDCMIDGIECQIKTYKLIGLQQRVLDKFIKGIFIDV